MKALLTLLLLYSCTKQASLERAGMGATISDVQMEVSHLKQDDWNVGKKRKAQVSHGVNFLLSLPNLDRDDLDYLANEKGVDAWIIRVIQDKGQSQLDLGSLYVLFRPPQASRGKGASLPRHVGIKINYAASYASMRFRSFECPAFGHNKRVKDMEVKGDEGSFEIVLGPAADYREKSQLVQLTPTAFNGGNSLVGRFFFEIAPYNSRSKTIYGSFERVPRFVEIESEESIEVDGCQGVHPERS